MGVYTEWLIHVTVHSVYVFPNLKNNFFCSRLDIFDYNPLATFYTLIDASNNTNASLSFHDLPLRKYGLLYYEQTSYKLLNKNADFNHYLVIDRDKVAQYSRTTGLQSLTEAKRKLFLRLWIYLNHHTIWFWGALPPLLITRLRLEYICWNSL